MLASVGVLAGCSKDAFLPSLSFAVPETYETKKSTAPVHITRWWAKFGSKELDHLMDEANVENLDLAVAVAKVDEAAAQAVIAGAPLWPSLTYNGNNQRNRSSGTLTPGVIVPGTERNTFTRVINASYVVDVWGANRAALDAALRTASASTYQLEVVRLTVRANLVNSFLTAAANFERVAVAERNLANTERILSVIRERLAAGTASQLDLAQQEVLVAQARAAIPALRLAAETSRTAIALLLGRPPQGFKIKARSARNLRLPPIRVGIPSSLLVRRPDVRQAEEALQAADANVYVARKAFFPTITLTGQVGFTSALLSTLFRPESFIYTIAAAVSQPIFQGHKLKGQLALNEATRNELLQTYRKTILQSLTDVENALLTLRENAKRETAQAVAVEKSREAFTLSEQRLREGTIDLQTLLNIQTTLINAEDLLIQIRLARLQGMVSLFQALGGDWDDTVVLFPVGSDG